MSASIETAKNDENKSIKFTIPLESDEPKLESDEPKQIEIPMGSTAIFVGANGTGKTRLATLYRRPT